MTAGRGYVDPPGCNRSPVLACAAGSGPDLDNSHGSRLRACSPTCTVTNTEPGRPGGSAATSSRSGPKLPADPPITHHITRLHVLPLPRRKPGILKTLNNSANKPGNVIGGSGVAAGCGQSGDGGPVACQTQRPPVCRASRAAAMARACRRPGPAAGGPEVNRMASPRQPDLVHQQHDLVERCWLCGIVLPTAQQVPDGGSGCADVRWYCRDMRACTRRWTTARPPAASPGNATTRPPAADDGNTTARPPAASPGDATTRPRAASSGNATGRPRPPVPATPPPAREPRT